MTPPSDRATASSGDLFLALDQGGQSSKALVFDRAGHVQAMATIPVMTTRPKASRVEQDPLQIVDSLRRCLEGIAVQLGSRLDQVRLAGLASQRSSIVCWDRATGEPLTPVISWQDRRGEDLVRALQREQARVKAITGLVLTAHYGASKIRWCLDHLPAVQAAARRRTLVSAPLVSYLLFQLCAERPVVVDPTIAARTLLWDLEKRDWSSELLAMFGIPETVLPSGVPTRHAYGHLQLGSRPVPLVVSTGDQSAALFAWGMPAADKALINLGTGAFVQRALRARSTVESQLLDSAIWDDGKQTLFSLEGSVNGCGSAIETIGEKLGFDARAIHNHASQWLAGDTPLLFLNGVSGLGSPYWVADFPTRFLGSGTAEQMMQAVLESVLFLLQINLEEMERLLGRPQRLQVAGGLASVRPLCQRLADLSGLEVERGEQLEATAVGLAFLLAESFSEQGSSASREVLTPRVSSSLLSRYRWWRRELDLRLPVR